VSAYLDAYRQIASLEQRNIVGVYEVGDLPDGGYVAVEFLPGGSLLDAIRDGLPIGRALRSLAEMCLALEAVHRIGWAHGALCADHFMFRESEVTTLLDFNVTEKVVGSLGLTQEPVLGKKVDLDAASKDPTTAARADFRAVGRILHAMLTGDLGLLQSTQEEAPADLYRATRLPLTLSALQPCLDGLLGVGSGDPTQRAEDVLVELLALKDVFPFDIRAPIPRVESRARSKR
jgi:serine/threonine-protein kinase PpkA